ncbi:hypothetical protein WJX73_004165 [Symbiochloris irregularis]|uniref:Uncharacterized protein n=1 Tax=Symbiochloris irregularis TaxID=706552 RepID=A0AAW1PBE5_9CHLO
MAAAKGGDAARPRRKFKRRVQAPDRECIQEAHAQKRAREVSAHPSAGLQNKSLLETTGLIQRQDISQGQETVRIPVYNTFNNETISANFVHLRDSIMKSDGARQLAEAGQAAMVDSGISFCGRAHHGGDGPYNSERQLLSTMCEGIFECGAECVSRHCASTRVVSQGLTLPLQVFHTGGDRGFGVRCAQGLAPGSFVVSYAGEGITDSEAEKLTGADSYLYDLSHFLEVRRSSSSDAEDPSDVDLSRTPPIPATSLEVYTRHHSFFVENGVRKQAEVGSPGKEATDAHESVDSSRESHIVLDARRAGNVARFVNHCCEPNCEMQCVLVEGDSGLWYHVALFAVKHIAPMEELTYNYGYLVGSSTAELHCNCGAKRCKGRLL